MQRVYDFIRQCGLAWMVALLMFSSVAMAEESDMSGFDANGDGKVTMSEVMRHIRPAVQKGFDALDRNHDGLLSSEDFSDVSEGMRKFENWLNELLKPFAGIQENADKTQTF